VYWPLPSNTIRDHRQAGTHLEHGCGDYIERMISHPAVKASLVDYLTVGGRLDMLEKGGPLWARHDRGREAARNERPLSAWAFARRMKQYAKEAGIKSPQWLRRLLKGGSRRKKKR
jgi:hypothetical protein